MPLDIVTPAQRRLVDELLVWDHDRPKSDPTLSRRLRERLETALAPLVAARDPSDPVWVSKSALDRLSCDGWYLDRIEAGFEWSVAAIRGTMAHRAIELDWATRRAHAPEDLVAHVWQQLASDPTTSEARFLNGLGPIDAGDLRQQAAQLVTEFRDTWPQLPASAHLRVESPVRVRLAGGRVVLAGTPDMTIGGVRDERSRMLLVDLKTGLRTPRQDRQELRFYALLLTLKYGVAPFRWAVFYVTECAWDLEDLDEALLDTAVRRVVDGVEQAVRTEADDAVLRLRGGAHCRWCTRRASCDAAADEPPPGTPEPSRVATGG